MSSLYELCTYRCALPRHLPQVGTGVKPHVCVDTCDAWHDACKDEFFAFSAHAAAASAGLEAAGGLRPCAEGAAGGEGPLLCSRLRDVAGSGEELCREAGGSCLVQVVSSFPSWMAATLHVPRAPVSRRRCGGSIASLPSQAPALPSWQLAPQHSTPADPQAVCAVRLPCTPAGLTPVNASSPDGGDGAASCFDGGVSYRTDMCVAAPPPPPQSGRHRGRGRSGGVGAKDGQAEDQEEETLSPAVYFVAFAVVASLLWLGYTTRQGIMVGAGRRNAFCWAGRANRGWCWR